MKTNENVMNNNIYLEHIYSTLPRVLSLFDMDETSKTYGVGDRYFWAWKLIDFGNGTFQGAVNGVARLIKNKLLPNYISEKKAIEFIDAAFQGAEYLTRNDGSLEEAFPNEASYCVTALVAYDLLTAIELLEQVFTIGKKGNLLNIVKPMISFIEKNDEYHAFISNHLATAVAALYKWEKLNCSISKKGKILLDRILENQSEEGWYREYEGADPGYQSLCTYYLSDAYTIKPTDRLKKSLEKSIKFISYFIHPDGSFGGVYGSRNTRFFYPGGFSILAKSIKLAGVVADDMKKSICSGKTVVLNTIDDPNLMPMFNSYCLAASNDCTMNNISEQLPFQKPGNFRKTFNEAGLIVDKKNGRYTIISFTKGGVCYSYSEENTMINTGKIIRDKKGLIYSNQHFNENNNMKITEDKIIVKSSFAKMHKDLFSPFKMIVLRLLNLSIMRIPLFNKIIKDILVKFLITGAKTIKVNNTRTITLGDKIKISDEFENLNKKYTVCKTDVFSHIHMASQGYWQIQDGK